MPAIDQAKGNATLSRWLLIGLRLTGAALALAMGWIHLYLWMRGYRQIPTIGPLFLLNAIGAAVLAVGLLVVPRRLLRPLSILGALFTAGTLGALILSLTVGLFGFHESMAAPLVTATILVESIGTFVLASTALGAGRAR